MLKRKVLKRVLPIVLSLAMTLQTVPMTVLAAEVDPQAATLTQEADTPAEAVTEAAADSSDSQSDEEKKPDEGTAVNTDTDSSENAGSSEGQSEPGAGTDTGADVNADTAAGTDTEANQEEMPTDTEADTNTAQPDEETQAEGSSTEIVVPPEMSVSGFDRVEGESRLTYTTSYSESSQFDGVISIVKAKVTITVNGEGTPSDFNDNYLTLEWREAGKTEAMTGTPQNVGSYVLHLEVKPQEGAWVKDEEEIYFNITPKKLTFDEASLDGVLSSTKAGSSVADFKDAVAKACKLMAGWDEFTVLQYTVKVTVSEVGAAEETADTSFSKNKDYRVKIDVEFADAEAGKNYEVSGAEYPVNFEGLLQTKVETKASGKEMVETYAKGTTYKALQMAEKYGVTAEVKAESKDSDGNSIYESFPAEVTVKEAVAKWYKKEINTNASITDFPTRADVDGITRFFGEDDALYTLMKAESGTEEVAVGDVGDYYLVFVYEGVDGQYLPSHSDPLKVTINPIDVILKPESIGAGIKLSTAMTAADITSALAKVESKLYVPDETEPTAKSDTPSDAPVTDKDFYGVSYDNASETQYYSPVFALVCKTRTKLPEASWPAGATDEQKWGKWSSLSPVTKIEKDTDSKQYQYFIKFTGNKAVYKFDSTTENYKKVDERPIAEATDAANLNYRVKTDADTLNNEKNMLSVELGEVKETEIDVTAIINEFNKEGGRGKGGTGLDAGNPAWTIYDPDAALFAGKESYKKAVVKNAEPAVKDTHKDITYTWQESYDVALYDEIIHMAAEEGETAEDFAERKASAIADLENTFTGNYGIPQDAGLYRLHITYKDSSSEPKNAPAVGDAYFLIKKQELMIVADTQYAKYGDSVWNFSKSGYRVYKLPENSEENFAKKDNLLDWQVWNLAWQAMNLKKNADGSDTAEWENSAGTFIKKDAPYAYTYKAAVWLNEDDFEFDEPVYDADGNPAISEAGNRLYWRNYTTKNTAAWDAAQNDYEQHFKVGDGFGDFQFDAAEIKIVVDRSKLPSDKTYDAKSFANELPAGLVALTDESGAPISPDKLQINGEPTGNVGTVWVEWKWKEATNDRGWDRIVPTEEAKFGGTYTLVASFDGCLYDDGTSFAPFQTEWLELLDENGKPYEVTINPLQVEITPVLNEKMTAGEKVSDMLEDGGRRIEYKTVNEGESIPAEDEWLFNWGAGPRWNAIGNYADFDDAIGYPILENLGTFTSVYYKDNEWVSGNARIRFGKKYDVKFSDNGLFAQYADSYELTYKPATLQEIARGDADVWSTDFYLDAANYNGGAGVSVYRKDKTDSGYTILPREGIPFVYDSDSFIDHYEDPVDTDLVTGKEIPHDKNYIAVDIVSPREFGNELQSDSVFAENNFVYGNSIKSAGGYVIDQYRDWDGDEGIYRYFITVLFPVEMGENGKIKAIPSFNVTWEKDYTDTFAFDLTNAQVEANLKQAVAPKSLAFNGVQAKMAVGEEQQLDVKITKAQLGDVIRINYRLAGGTTSNDYASINPETGLITALATKDKKPTAVNVEAYPVRLAADGKTYEEITGKGVKVAKTKVTITEVTAPVIKKIIPKDISAEVQFTQVANGYRGEIYVKKFDNKKDANKYKAANFESEIAKVKNGQWKGTFAVAPMYFSGTRGYDEKLKLCRKTISGLEKGFYVVYVRNVSAVRTLADGSKTTESAAGAVKMFETTKSQVLALDPYFEVVDPKTKANPVKYKNGVDEREGYTVELADKSAQLLVEGEFSDLSVAADKSDTIWYQLSLKAAEKTLGRKLTDTYLDPKLIYYITDGVAPSFDENHKLENPSKYVTINNKGKLTFKGVDKDGELKVRVYVAVADNTSINDYCELTITARPDTVATKKVKTMKVGDAIRLKDYLEYKKGKTKVPNYWSSSIEITNWDEAESNGFWVYRYGDDPNADRQVRLSVDGELRQGEIIIVAKKENASWDLKLKDWLWTSDSDEKKQTEEKTIRLATTKLDPVKGLKTVYTDDKHITLNFTHAGHPEAFDIEVKDARGSIVYKRLAYRSEALNHIVSANAKTWLQNQQRASLDDFMYFEKTKTYAYTISTEKLMRLSSYKISVTPVYDDAKAAKAVTTKAKTTNIPASYANGDIENPDYYFEGVGLNFNGNTYRAYLTSGNTYTVTTGANRLAQARGTDTLTWKSSNAKVASIKANQGSFSATLKALQQGKTTITVTSKVTKKTIARYQIAVKAVGKGNGYSGDYENGGNYFYDEFIKTVDPYYEGRMEVLTVSNSVTVTSEDYLNSNPSRDRTWVKFTAPSYGEYTFASTGSNYQLYYADESETNANYINSRTLRLEKDQVIYFKVAGSFTLKVSKYTDFTKLTGSFTADKPLTVNKETWVSFTATEDNYYTFNGSSSLVFEQNGQSVALTTSGRYSYEKGMKAGETIFIKVSANGSLWVTKRALDTALTTGGAGVNLTITKDNAEDTQYLKFTAAVTGEHTFTYSPKDKITVVFYGLDDKEEIPADGTGAVIAAAKVLSVGEGTEIPAESQEETVKLFIEKDETIAIAVTAKDPSAITDDTTKIEANVKVAEPVGVKTLAVGEQEVSKATTQMFEYTIPNDKAAAKYTLTATENASITWYYGRTEREVNGWYGSTKKLASLDAIAYNGDSFTVKDGGVSEPNLTGNESLHAGDKIYIEVTVAPEAAANAKVTLTRATADGKTFDTATPATVVLGAKTDDAEWYTFKAKKTGYYEFTRKVTVAPETSTAQSATVGTVSEAFSTDEDYRISLSSDTPVVKKLDAGDYVFMIKADSNATAENDKTTVVLTAKEIVPETLAVGETPVAVSKGETKYYTFKRATSDAYEIKWEPGTDVGTPTVEYTTRDLTGSYTAFNTVNVANNSTYTIRLKADDAKNLSGKLQVVAAKTTEFLTSGVAKDFSIAKDSDTVEYKFTLPEKNELGYVVILENTSTVPEGGTVPTITVSDVTDGYLTIISNLAKGKEAKEVRSWTENAFTTKTIRIRATNVTETAEGVTAINATGKITIKPITVNPFVTAVGKVNKGDEPKWYTYTVPADGRYQLNYAVGTGQDKNGINVTWYEKAIYDDKMELDRISDDVPYLTKGQNLYVKVAASNTIADAGVDVTLDPKELAATPLTLANGKAEVDVTAEMVANGAVYYTLEAPDYASYTLENYADTCLYVPDDDGGSDYWYSGYSLEKGQKILIKVTTAGKLTVTQNAITELKLDTPSGEITLAKDGGSASFVLNIFKDGYYDFRVSDAGGLSIDEGMYIVYQTTESKCYFVADISQEYSDRYEFTVTNYGSEDAKINVTASALTPVTLKLGETDIPVTKDRVSVVEFKAPESYWYTIGCSAGSKMSLADVEDIEGSKDVFLYKTEDDEDISTGVLSYSGTETSATAKVTISKLVPEPVSGEKIAVSLENGASKWYAYTTEKAGLYTVTAPEGVSLFYYSSLENGYSEETCSAGGSMGVRTGVNAVLYIKAMNNSGAKVEGDSANITVACEAATDLKEGENALTGDIQYKDVYLTFKAPEDGMYRFSQSGSGYLYYYGERAWNGNYQFAYPSNSFFVKKDGVVYLTERSNDVENSITVTKVADAKFLGHVDVKEGKYQWITFTAPETGEYEFCSVNQSGDPRAWFFRDQNVGNNADNSTLNSKSQSEGYGYSDDEGEGSNFAMTISLGSGETVYIAAGNYILQAGSYDVCVSY